MMLSEERGGNDIYVLSIVGMAGVGKTTVAQLVYNDKQVVDHFGNSRIWVSISMEDTVQTITKLIFESTTEIRCQVSYFDFIQTRLQTRLSPQKFLIVLDGMWNENTRDWDVLCLPFKVAAKGSKILVTTRSMIVSSIISTIPAYHVQTLSDKECWDLMKQRALLSINEDKQKQLEEIGLKIAQKCRGLPLAARVIGSILRFKSDEMEWEAVLKGKFWDLEDAANDILPVLKLSYDHLPSFLKRCFSYCSIFPKNFEFKSDELVQLWVTEGFFQQRRIRSTKDIGKDYFDLLLSRSLFQFSHKDDDNHLIYKMHDLIHDLAEFVSDELCFRMEDNISQPLPNLKNTRHSSLVCKDIQPETWKVFYKCGHLRTFMLLFPSANQVNLIPEEIFLKLPYIRVLNLSCTIIRVLPDTIRTLKHLRHLNASNTNIESLPASITNLHGLETIKLKNCLKLSTLPDDMSKLTNLQHLELDIKAQISFMPAQFGKLTSLQTLPAFIVGKEEGQKIEELKDMRCLRGSICITNLENVKNNSEAITTKLEQKSYLDKLELEWNEITRSQLGQEVLAGLQPHNRIKELHISGYCGVTFPAWLSSPSFCKLQSIYLNKCCKCIFLLFLGHLPMLSSLHIDDIGDLENLDSSFMGYRISFPSLLRLRFENMPNLQNWTNLVNGSMPKLCHLEIENCPILKFLPSFQCLTSLETLNVGHYPKVQFLPGRELPQSLNSLIIRNCDILKEQCDERNGQDWIKIRSVASIEIDDQVIRKQQHTI